MTEVKTPVDEKPVLADQADMDGASALAALASAASLAQNTSVKQEAKGIKNEYDEVGAYTKYTLQRKSHLCITFPLKTARSRSQFPYTGTSIEYPFF
jgi:hypothetical protein